MVFTLILALSLILLCVIYFQRAIFKNENVRVTLLLIVFIRAVLFITIFASILEGQKNQIAWLAPLLWFLAIVESLTSFKSTDKVVEFFSNEFIHGKPIPTYLLVVSLTNTLGLSVIYYINNWPKKLKKFIFKMNFFNSQFRAIIFEQIYEQ